MMLAPVIAASSAIADVAASTPSKVPVDTPEIVEAVQVKLRSLGYVGAGPPDGKDGGKTQAAILDFRNRNNLPSNTSIDGDLLAALLVANPKVLPIEQTTATAAEIAPKIAAVKTNLWTKFWAKVAAIPTFIGALSIGIISNLGDAIAAITPLKTFLQEWLEGVDRLTLVVTAATVTAVVSGIMWLNSRNTDSAMTAAYRGGTLSNDNEEAPK